MKTENKIVKFWPKLLARIIDLIIISGFSTLLAAFVLETRDGKQHFIEPWAFYVWAIFTAFLFFIFFFLVPFYWKGKSIGMFVVRIKVVPLKYGLKMTIIKREIFYGWAWIVMVLLLTVVINHTMIIKVASKQDGVVYKGWEAFRVSIFSTITGVIVIIQLIFGISGLIRKDGISFHDKMASSKTVWINKFTEVKNIKKQKNIRPTRAKNNHVEWINKGE